MTCVTYNIIHYFFKTLNIKYTCKRKKKKKRRENKGGGREAFFAALAMTGCNGIVGRLALS
jgi:hypothetical protein